MTIKDNPQQKDVVNRVQGVTGKPEPMPDPDQRSLEKADDDTHSRLVEEAGKSKK